MSRLFGKRTVFRPERTTLTESVASESVQQIHMGGAASQGGYRMVFVLGAPIHLRVDADASVKDLHMAPSYT